MTIYGQNLGGFKRENNECIRNGEKIKLYKIKIVVFFYLACVVLWRVFRHVSSRFTSLRRHIDVKRDEIRVMAPHMSNQKKLQFLFYVVLYFLRCE